MHALQFRPRPKKFALFPIRRAGKIGSLARLNELARALIVELFGVGQRMYGDVRFKAICPLPHFPTDVFPLPSRPVRNVAKFRLALLGGELGKRAHLPCLFAGIAPKAGAPRVHHEFLAAMRALVQDIVQPVRAVGVGQLNVVLTLIGIVVPLHRGMDAAVDLVCGKAFYFLLRRNALQFAPERNVLFVLVPLRRGDKRAVQPQDDGGHLHEFAHFSEGIGQKSRRAVQGIARLGIEADDRAVFVCTIAHIADEVQVLDEFALADAAEAAHEPVADVADGVDRDHVVGVIRRNGGVHGGEIQHARVRHKQQIGRPDAIHVDLFHRDRTPFQARLNCKHARDPHPERAGL